MLYCYRIDYAKDNDVTNYPQTANVYGHTNYGNDF